MDLAKITGKTGVIAHRGAAGLFPENTMTAFRKVQELGVDAIELDVRPTSDGRAVVIHDPDLNRVGGINATVSEMTFQELSEIKLLTGDRIPELESVLKEVKIPVLVELKTPEVLNPVIRVLRRSSSFIEKCLLISFHHDLLKSVKRIFPESSTGALFMGYPDDPVSAVKRCEADIISLHFGGLTGEYVEKCHDGGIAVNTWTPNSSGEISRSIAAGVDSITSDRPDLVSQELDYAGKARL